MTVQVWPKKGGNGTSAGKRSYQVRSITTGSSLFDPRHRLAIGGGALPELHHKIDRSYIIEERAAVLDLEGFGRNRTIRLARMPEQARGRGARIRLWLGWGRGGLPEVLKPHEGLPRFGDGNGTVHDFTATTLDGREKPLSNFAGQVLLVVNTASKWGFTRQYEGFEAHII